MPALTDGGDFRAVARRRRLGVFLIVSAASRCVFSASTAHAGALLPAVVSVVPGVPREILFVTSRHAIRAGSSVAQLCVVAKNHVSRRRVCAGHYTRPRRRAATSGRYMTVANTAIAAVFLSFMQRCQRRSSLQQDAGTHGFKLVLVTPTPRGAKSAISQNAARASRGIRRPTFPARLEASGT